MEIKNSVAKRPVMIYIWRLGGEAMNWAVVLGRLETPRSIIILAIYGSVWGIDQSTLVRYYCVLCNIGPFYYINWLDFCRRRVNL